ncbi:MAG: Transcriptional regulator, GntR family [Acidobacteriaceae bacterium]|nr:Transcriptional regulator, GntR family [Acidobacteriaceae bacterium]
MKRSGAPAESGTRKPQRATNRIPKASRVANDSSVSEVAYEGLLDFLLSGNLRPNDVVVERRIAAQLGVSRTPLREAIRRLEGEKLLSRQNGGTIVVSPMSTEDFLNILHVRRLLEGEAARRAAGRVSLSKISALRKRIVGLKSGPHDETADATTLGRELHIHIAEASGNPLLASLIGDLGKRTRLFMRVFERQAEVCDEHLAVIDALVREDGEGARAAMELHIDNMRFSILKKLGTL